MTFINFAYGSNMCTLRLRARTPSARPMGVAQLTGHRLLWHKIGADGSGKCDIHCTGHDDDVVWGVLFEIDLAERHWLDQAEGLGHGYEHKTVQVRTPSGVIAAGAYHATHIDPQAQPFDWYRDFVLAGAREHGLPPSYVQALSAVVATEDPDTVRRDKNLALRRAPWPAQS